MGNIKYWLWVIFLVLIVANGCWEEERSALLVLEANMMSSNGGLLAVWAGYNETGFVDCCSWRAIKCSLATGRVIKLDLRGARLGSGDGWRFNASLFLPFKSLQVLILSENYLTGWTKNEGFDKLSHLTNLKVLDLQNNPPHPNVLSSLCWISSLEVLRLGVVWDKPTLGSIKFPSPKNYTVHIEERDQKCPGLSNLRVLWLAGYGINDISVLSALDLIALSNLESLDLRMNNFESFMTIKVLTGSEIMSSLRNLQLGSSNSNSTKVLQSLKSFSNLRSLFYGNSNLTAPAITYALRNLSTLEYLDLRGSSLNENFLSSIGQMTSLKLLSMSSGDNSGTLPNQGWCELKNIQELDFTDNRFEGTLPSCLENLTSLEYLDISFNQFEVPLSFKQFSNHSKLTYLNVGYNKITVDIEFQNWIPNFQLELFAIQGCINLQKLPSFLHYQYDLRILAIEGNHLEGNFPTWLLENNTRLAGFYARDNAFIGPLKLPSSPHLHLENIDVSNNKLIGHIPANMSLAFPRLTFLNMSQNFLEGPIPSKISGFHVYLLDLSNNFLSGGVPSDLIIGSPELLYLRLSNNKLKGQIFSEEVRPHALSFLYLNGNNFEGPLPRNIFIRPLIVLDASRNNFTGEIPRWIRDNTRLLQLDLSKNQLEGSIPIEICNLKNIRVLAISENRLSGSIPSCVSSLSLEHIHLEKNQLGGELEHVLFNISSLITLDLGYNSFTGNIPHTIGSLYNINYVLLNNNQLEGHIPTQVCALNKLSIMDLSFNKLYGPALPCLGYLTQAKKDADIRGTYFATTSRDAWLYFLVWISSTRHYHDTHEPLSDVFLMDVETQVQFSTKRNSYTYKGSILNYMSGIDLSSNRLTGEIPMELGNLSKMHALNLSHNHLIGRIPNTFSNLHEIESLDLSYNSLNGRIPVGLLELNSLAIFSVAYNNLSGAVPEFKAQFATFDKSSYEGNPFLCGYPLDNNCRSTNLSNTSKNTSEESAGLADMECFYIGFLVSYGAILLGIAAALCFNPYWRKAWFRMVEALMLCSYYFLWDNLVTPIKSRWCRNLG